MQRMQVQNETYTKLEIFIKKSFTHFQKDILELAKKFTDNYPKELCEAYIKWTDGLFHNDSMRSAVENTLTLLADPNLIQAFKDGLLPPLEPLFRFSLTSISSFSRLKDEDVINAIKTNKLPIKEIVKWSDSELWQRFSLFHPEKLITQKRYYLLDALCRPVFINALNQNLIDIDKIKALAKVDMIETAQLLDTLNSCAMSRIFSKAISFDQIFELAWQHGAKQAGGFIRALSERKDNTWLRQSDLTAHDILQAALNYDGALIDLTQKIWYAKDEELYDMLRNEAHYLVMRM